MTSHACRGTLLPVLFALVIGTCLLPEPCDAALQDSYYTDPSRILPEDLYYRDEIAPEDYYYRDPRSAEPEPEPRCPHCPKDCSESLSGSSTLPLNIPHSPVLAKPYPPPQAAYSPPAYPPPPPGYNLPPPTVYSAPPPPGNPPPAAPYVTMPKTLVPYAPASAPCPLANRPPPPPPPPQTYNYPLYRPPPPPLPPTYNDPAAYQFPSLPPPPPPPSPPQTYNQAPALPKIRIYSEDPAENVPCDSGYKQHIRPAPLPVRYSSKPYGPSALGYNASPPTSYSPPLPTSYNAIPRYPSPPSSKYSPPMRYNLPMPRYSPRTPLSFKQYNYSPYYNPGSSEDCGYDDDNEEEDEPIYSKYNRRSLDSQRVYRHYQYQDAAPYSSMYPTYPYAEPAGAADAAPQQPQYSAEESQRRVPAGRERLYVVYRADEPVSSDPSSPHTPTASDQSLSDRELEIVIRKAIAIARQQRAQENALLNRPDRHRYETANAPSSTANDQPEFWSLNQNYHENQHAKRHHHGGNAIVNPHYPVVNYYNQYELSPSQRMENERFVIREEGDEANNPGWDQSKWTKVPDVPSTEFGIESEVSEFGEAEDTPKKEDSSKKSEKIEKAADLIEDMELPQVVTEASSFDRLPEMTTIKKKT